jgi:hypothetical protein
VLREHIRKGAGGVRRYAVPAFRRIAADDLFMSVRVVIIITFFSTAKVGALSRAGNTIFVGYSAEAGKR